jgi:hypothetical protein
MEPFYIHDGADILTLRIIGPLAGGATAEVEQAWLTARSTLAGRGLVVELGDHAVADIGGMALLRHLARHGARFVTTSPLADALAEAASQRTPEFLPTPKPTLWNRLACCLRIFCGLVKAQFRRALPCRQIVRKLW